MNGMMCCLAACLTFLAACSESQEEITMYNRSDVTSGQGTPTSSLATLEGEQVLDGNGDPQTCTEPTDPPCDEEGPGKRKACAADGFCYLYLSENNCNYPDNAPLTCGYQACSNDSDCEAGNVDLENLISECVFTANSFANTDSGGHCAWWYKDCSVLLGTPCEANGKKYESPTGQWICSVTQGDMTKAMTETCNGQDDDCDGAMDEGFSLGEPCDSSDSDQCKKGTYTCADSELENECVNETAMNVTETCNGQDDDCDGTVDEDFPTLGDSCDGTDADSCKNGSFQCAADGASATCQNDAPAMVETCNGLDDDCDGAVDEGVKNTFYADNDADGHGGNVSVQACDQPAGTSLTSDDCDDTKSSVNPSATETCNGLDDDCDGEVDETFPLGVACDGADSDLCKNGVWTCKADTTGVECASETAMNVTETCNGLDDDCDTAVDENFALGGACTAGSGVCKTSGTFVCSPDGQSSTCSASPDMTKATAESCNGLDDNCDGATDEGCDDDGDDWCDVTMAYDAGAACAMGDCDDTKSSVNPSATETCNGVNDNCNGTTDEGCDSDNDGFCDVSMAFAAGAECLSGDCNDADGNVHPATEEVCLTAYDDNCDGSTEFKSDGVTPACDSCANVVKLACNTETTINMATQANTANSIDKYTCMTKVGPKGNATTFSAPEVILTADAPAGTSVSFQVVPTGATGLILARLHGSCAPNSGTSEVTPFKQGSAMYTGTCAQPGVTSISDIVAGQDFVSLDAATSQTVTVKFTCP